MLLFDVVINTVRAVQYQPDGSPPWLTLCSVQSYILTIWSSVFVSLSVSWCLLGLLLRVSFSSLTPCMLLCLFLINLWGVCVSMCVSVCVGCSPALFPGGKWKHNPLEFNQTGLKKASIHKAIKVTNCMITDFTLTAKENSYQLTDTLCGQRWFYAVIDGSSPNEREIFILIDPIFKGSSLAFFCGPIDFCFKCDRQKVCPGLLHI